MMKLYDTKGAPSSRRVRIFLAEKGIEVEKVPIDLRQLEQFGDAYQAVNPWVTVPTLELEDGTRIGESVAICRYIEAVQPEPALFGDDPLAQGRVEMWNRRVELECYLGVVELFRNSAPHLKERAWPGPLRLGQIPELADRGRRRASWFFGVLDEELKTRDYIAGDTYSVADITALTTIDFARRVGLELADEAVNLRRWHDQVSQRPSANA